MGEQRTKQASTYLSPFAAPAAVTTAILTLGAAFAGAVYSATHRYERAIVTGGFVLTAITGFALALVAVYYRARAEDLGDSLADAVDELKAVNRQLQIVQGQANLATSITAVLTTVEARSKRSWLPWKR
jgi:hypothetical protein